MCLNDNYSKVRTSKNLIQNGSKEEDILLMLFF
jgi:hypothetical protein